MPASAQATAVVPKPWPGSRCRSLAGAGVEHGDRAADDGGGEQCLPSGDHARAMTWSASVGLPRAGSACPRLRLTPDMIGSPPSALARSRLRPMKIEQLCRGSLAPGPVRPAVEEHVDALEDEAVRSSPLMLSTPFMRKMSGPCFISSSPSHSLSFFSSRSPGIVMPTEVHLLVVFVVRLVLVRRRRRPVPAGPRSPAWNSSGWCSVNRA